MKALLILFAALVPTSFFTLSAYADQTLLECSIPYKTRRDVKTVIVSDTGNGLSLTEITQSGKQSVSLLPEHQWTSKNIRLSNTSDGFRYLRYTYSEIFHETNWFVIENGPGFRAEGRADCR